jgi:peptide deformylase
MVKDIVIYPDKRLKLISKKVEKFDDELHQLLDDMYDTMIAKGGVGLAAIQIGVDRQVLIINIPKDNAPEDAQQPKENTLEMINPKLITSDGTEKSQEGCLSVPEVYEDVVRAKHVVVEYQDRDGNLHTIDNDDFLAVAIQHEMDHLNGKLFIEKLSIVKRKKFEKEWRKRGKKKK